MAMSKLLSAILSSTAIALAAVAGGAQAQGMDVPQKPVVAPAAAATALPAGGAVAGEDQIRIKVEQRFGRAPTTVQRTPFGLIEVVIGGEIYYVDSQVNYMLSGKVVDLRTQEDLTEKRRMDITRVDFKSLPLDLAFKDVHGKGERVVVTFQDPNCGYCRRLHDSMKAMDNVTIYTFLYPILSQDSFDKSRDVWCNKNRTAAWTDTMEGRTVPTTAAECPNPLQKTLELGQKLGVNGTPTLVFADGRRLPGAYPIERIEQMMAEAAPKK